MNTFKSSIIAIALAMIVGGAGSALAEDFVFTVPLKLQNLHPEIDKVLVICAVSDKFDKKELGVGSKEIPVGPNGTLSKDVVVAFNIKANHIASDATQYTCSFRLLTKTDGMSFPYVPTQNPKTPPFEQAKPGTPFVQMVKGPIPLQAEVKKLWFNNQ